MWQEKNGWQGWSNILISMIQDWSSLTFDSRMAREFSEFSDGPCSSASSSALRSEKNQKILIYTFTESTHTKQALHPVKDQITLDSWVNHCSVYMRISCMRIVESMRLEVLWSDITSSKITFGKPQCDTIITPYAIFFELCSSLRHTRRGDTQMKPRHS